MKAVKLIAGLVIQRAPNAGYDVDGCEHIATSAKTMIAEYKLTVAQANDIMLAREGIEAAIAKRYGANFNAIDLDAELKRAGVPQNLQIACGITDYLIGALVTRQSNLNTMFA